MGAPQLTVSQQGVTVLSGDQLNTYEQTCDSFAELRGFQGTQGVEVYARGQTTVGDGYQGIFYWLTGGAMDDDNVSNIVPAGGGGQWTRLPVSLVGVSGTSGYVLTAQGVGATPVFAPSTTTPTGSSFSVQYNNGGAFGGAGPGTSGYVLTSTGASSAPSFQLIPPSAVAGSVRNGYMLIPTPASSVTFTADQVVVYTTLGSAPMLLPSYNQTLNVGTTGAGGMDTGTAPTSGAVSIYAISGISGTSILACNATVSQSTIYAGSNMPAGYTYSSLISQWVTNSSGQLIVGIQHDRNVSTTPITVISGLSTQASALTNVSLTSGIPPVAKSVTGHMTISSTVFFL